MPAEAKQLSTKWVFNIKRDSNSEAIRYKARLVVRGFEQQPGVDYNETFSPVAWLDSFRVLCAISAAKQLRRYRFDISTAFLNGKLEEEVFVRTPDGVSAEPGQCLRLKKALYGLEQAPRAWNCTFDTVMDQLGFRNTHSHPCVYKHKDRLLILLVYVDDCLLFGEDRQIWRPDLISDRQSQ